MTTRRSFLKKGLFGGLLLFAGGAGLAVFPTKKSYTPRKPLNVLDEKRFAILAAVAARVVQAPGVDPAGIAHGIDDTIALWVPEAQKDFCDLLALFDNGLAGLLFDGHARPFTRLGPEAQDGVLTAWRDSRIGIRRAGYQVLRKLTAGVHYAQPSTWASVGYPGPPTINVPT
jgi:hypothetical protein